MMKKLLYVTFNDINPTAGVSKKIIDQVDAFRNNGLDARLLAIITQNGKRTANIDKLQLSEISHGIKGQIQIVFLYRKILDYIKENNIDMLYVRYTQNADFFYILFLYRCKKIGCKILLEIPTYPYDGEFWGKKAILQTQILVERVFRKQLKNCVDYIVTTSELDTILGIDTIRISNAVNEKNIPVVCREPKKDNEIVLISVATISFWHGLDRLISGLEKYYLTRPKKKVRLIIVGGGDSDTLKQLLSMIDNSVIKQYIEYVGPKQGEELISLFNKADLAVGCLACHRKNIVEVKSLKNVDYAMRGLPMFYSESNADFDRMPYVLRVPADETPIEISSLIYFLQKQNMKACEIRNSVLHLTWDEQIKKILNVV